MLDKISCIWHRSRLSVAHAAKGLTTVPPPCKVPYYDWPDDGLFEKMCFAFLLQAREAAGRRTPTPISGGAWQFRSYKTTPSGGPARVRCGQEGQRT